MTPMTLTLPPGGCDAPRERSPCAQWPAPVELGQLERVDVQQRPGLGPLIAPRGLRALAAPLTTDAVTLEHLPDRRAVPAGQPRQAHRPPVGLRSASRIACSSCTLSAHGHDRGREERVRRHARDARCSRWRPASDATSGARSPARRSGQAAACPERRPLLDQLTSSRRPCSPSLHLRSSMSGLLRRCLSSLTAPSVGGRTPPSTVHEVRGQIS